MSPTDLVAGVLLTYLAHSTLLLGVASAVDRAARGRWLTLRQTLWRAALVGALITTALSAAGPLTPLASHAAAARAEPTPATQASHPTRSNTRPSTAVPTSPPKK